MTQSETTGPEAFRRLLEREPGLFAVAVLTLGFDLAAGVAGRYLPAYLRALDAGPAVVGLVWSGWLLARATYPYLGGRALDDADPRYVTTGFGVVATAGALLWVAAPQLGSVGALGASVGPWLWVLLGVAGVATWRSHGPGVRFVAVARRIPTDRLAGRLATTRTFRRFGVLLGVLALVGLFVGVPRFALGFQAMVAVAASFGLAATVGRAVLGDAEAALPLAEAPSLERIVGSLRAFVPVGGRFRFGSDAGSASSVESTD
ncbi:hypothetical protein ACFO3H_16445, partial [Halorussus sp. GCM10023401]